MNKWRKPWPSWVWDWIAGHILNPKPTTAQRKRKSIWVYVWRKWEDLGFCAATVRVRVGYKGGTNHEANRLCVCFLFFVFFFFLRIRGEKFVWFENETPPIVFCLQKQKSHAHTAQHKYSHNNNKDTNLCLSVPSLSSSSIFKFTNFDCIPGA